MPPRIDPTKKPVSIKFDLGAYQSPFADPGATAPAATAPPAKASPSQNVEGNAPKWMSLKGNPPSADSRKLTSYIGSKPGFANAMNAPVGPTFKAGQNTSGLAMNAQVGQTPGASGTYNAAKSSAGTAKPAGGVNLFSGEFKTGLANMTSKFRDPGLNGVASLPDYSALNPAASKVAAAPASPEPQIITPSGKQGFSDSRAAGSSVGKNAGAYASPLKPPPPKDHYAEFLRQTGTPFDKNSVQDRESMKRMMASSDGKSGTLSSAQWRALKRPTTR